jgi:DNA replication and repair protein RecF
LKKPLNRVIAYTLLCRCVFNLPMTLCSIDITNFRNLRQVNLNLHAKFNVLCGANGSGKTSFLEAIYYLNTGHSFRSAVPRNIITYDADGLIVFGRLGNGDGAGFPLGVERKRDGTLVMRAEGESITTKAKLISIQPMQLINTSSHLLLTTPKYRRKFIDWGVFYLVPEFLSCWQKAYRILKQRNVVLKQRPLQHSLLKPWDEVLVDVSVRLHNLRARYVEMFLPVLHTLLAELLGDAGNNITVDYYAGWDTGEGLSIVLQKHLTRDTTYGYTGFGPHRADIGIKIDNIPAAEILSRGQQKLLVCALKLAQGVLLRQITNKSCLFLIDDLAAELDGEALGRVIGVLRKTEAQTFITGIKKDELCELFLTDDIRMFHVKHGAVLE